MTQGGLAAMLVCIAVLDVPTASVAQRELVRELVSAAAVIRSGDKEYRSMKNEVRSRITEFNRPPVPDSRTVVHAFYQEPDSYAMCIYDATSGAPVMYSTPKGMVLYDLVTNKLLYGTPSLVYWSLKYEYAGRERGHDTRLAGC